MSEPLDQLLQEAARDTLGMAQLALQAALSGRYHAAMDLTLGVLLVLDAIIEHVPILWLGAAFVLYGGLHLRHWHQKVAYWQKRVAHWQRWIREVGEA